MGSDLDSSGFTDSSVVEMFAVVVVVAGAAVETVTRMRVDKRGGGSHVVFELVIGNLVVDFHVRGGRGVGPLVVGRVVGTGVGNVRSVVYIAPSVVGTVCGVVGFACGVVGFACGVVGFACGVVWIACGVDLGCVGRVVGVLPASVPAGVVGIPVDTTGGVVGGPKMHRCPKCKTRMYLENKKNLDKTIILKFPGA